MSDIARSSRGRRGIARIAFAAATLALIAPGSAVAATPVSASGAQVDSQENFFCSIVMPGNPWFCKKEYQ